jgi:hypothetical protein
MCPNWHREEKKTHVVCISEQIRYICRGRAGCLLRLAGEQGCGVVIGKHGFARRRAGVGRKLFGATPKVGVVPIVVEHALGLESEASCTLAAHSKHTTYSRLCSLTLVAKSPLLKISCSSF